MSAEMPATLPEYNQWLQEELGISITDQTRTYYETVMTRVRADFQHSGFWIQLTENLREYNHEYLLRSGYPLPMHGFEPKVHIKPYDSLLLKTFRKNVLENKQWSAEPERGWIVPANWYSKLNDLVRTRLVVKYLDGVEFLCSKIHSLCDQHGMLCEVSFEASEEGYYAAHLLARRTFEIPGPLWDTQRVDMSVEIQITTQLQEVITRLLHKYYEERRKGLPRSATKWQWNYQSDEFSANYLGHILHYVEGMIMEIRDRQARRTT